MKTYFGQGELDDDPVLSRRQQERLCSFIFFSFTAIDLKICNNIEFASP